MIPVSAEVLEFNSELDGNPALINEDPYEKGWIIKIKPTNPAEADGLLTAAQYADLIK